MTDIPSTNPSEVTVPTDRAAAVTTSDLTYRVLVTGSRTWTDRLAVGGTYLERGLPVLVERGWRGRGPRNVLIRRADGSQVVRPFRGLRRPAEEPKT